MKFTEIDLKGAFLIELEPRTDERGFFARTFCSNEFAHHNLETCFVQCNLSLSRHRGSLRGLHFQWAPRAEAKLVRCVRGAIWDVIVDLRPGSPTFGRHESVEMTAENRSALYVPKGFAHGFQTLLDDTEVFYQMSTAYAPEAASGILATDPDLGIRWPLPVTAMSDKDRELPLLAELRDRLLHAVPTSSKPIYASSGKTQP